jgi:hypothetical protein
VQRGSGVLHRYRASLRDALAAEAKAYGFTLVTWGTGAMTTAVRGTPDAPQALAYVGGAFAAMALVILVTFAGTGERMTGEPPGRRLAWGAVHLVSVAAGLAAGWGAAELVVPRWGAFLCAGAAATLAYQLVLGLEVALSARGDDQSSPER